MNSEQKKNLRAKAHALKPVIITGNAGITEALINETHNCLDQHELIKVRINASDREQRKEMIDSLLNETGSELIQSIGHIATLYRKNPNKN